MLHAEGLHDLALVLVQAADLVSDVADIRLELGPPLHELLPLRLGAHIPEETARADPDDLLAPRGSVVTRRDDTDFCVRHVEAGDVRVALQELKVAGLELGTGNKGGRDGGLVVEHVLDDRGRLLQHLVEGGDDAILLVVGRPSPGVVERLVGVAGVVGDDDGVPGAEERLALLDEELLVTGVLRDEVGPDPRRDLHLEEARHPLVLHGYLCDDRAPHLPKEPAGVVLKPFPNLQQAGEPIVELCNLAPLMVVQL
mmetsp:Transcript_40466/g.96184  ORF Transcript_40466/g.96184 Transcript_40466/m.96184 type:complete len:255 (-) Transcript_40466:1488-2252(-)